MQVPEEGQDYVDEEEKSKGPRNPEDDLDLTSLQLVNAMISDKRARAKAAVMAKPQGLHSQLRLHDLENIPTSARELLGPSSSRHNAAAAAGKKAIGGGGGGAGGPSAPASKPAAKQAGMLAPKPKS